MSMHTWRQWVHSLRTRLFGKRLPGRARHRRYRLGMEPLEHRIVPATFVVNATTDTHAVSSTTSPADSTGHISLRSAIEAADKVAGDTTITFDSVVFATAQTITLSLGGITMGDPGHTITLQGPAAGVTANGNA